MPDRKAHKDELRTRLTPEQYQVTQAQGQKKPSGPSRKLLNLVDRKGLEALN